MSGHAFNTAIEHLLKLEREAGRLKDVMAFRCECIQPCGLATNRIAAGTTGKALFHFESWVRDKQRVTVVLRLQMTMISAGVVPHVCRNSRLPI